MTSRQGDHLRITSLSWGESTDDRCIPLTRRLRCGALMLCLLLAWTSCWKKQQICGNLRCPDAQAIMMMLLLDDVIKWKHFPRNWPFVRGIHRSRWFPRTKASDAELWCFFICAWINDWVNNREAGDLRRYRGHYDVIVMRSSHHDDVARILPLQICVNIRRWN